MDMGEPSNERARLDALIAAAAPDPLPADQAIALLQQLGETDAAVLGRLAYHALTGVAPGDGEPASPAEVAPGFPPFAAEVLMRAIAGPDHRRPTAQALLIVLDTVPAASWPTAGQPEVVLADVAEPVEPIAEPDPDPAPVVEAVVEPIEPVGADVEVVEPDPEPTIVPEVEVDEEVEELVVERRVARALEHQEFRDLLTPNRSIPRFDPLTDPLTAPWYPDDEDRPFTPPVREPEPEPVAEPVVEPEPVAEVVEPEEPEAEPAAVEVQVEVEEPEPVVEPEPEAVVEPEPEPVTPVAPVAPVSPVRGMHDEFRDFASPSLGVTPREQPDPKAREPKVRDPKPEKEPREPKVANPASNDDRHQTLVLVAVIAILILVGVIYATSKGSDETDGDGAGGGPQGASRSMVQPASAAV